MRELEIDGKKITVFATRNDQDGGIITCTIVPAGDGSYYEYRTWEGRGIKLAAEDYPGDDARDPKEVEAEKLAAQEAALAKFYAMSDEEIASRATSALEAGNSGKLFR